MTLQTGGFICVPIEDYSSNPVFMFYLPITHKELNLVMCETCNMFGHGDGIPPQGGQPRLYRSLEMKFHYWFRVLWGKVRVHQVFYPAIYTRLPIRKSIL